MADPIAPTSGVLVKANRRFVWKPIVIVDSVDISEKVRGQIEIIFAEDTSTIAKYSFIPDDGQINLLAMVGLSVTIDHYEIGPLSDPDQPWIMRRFTGVISKPVYQVAGGYIEVECTADLQGYFDTGTRANIDTLIAGEYSKHIFNEDDSNWQYAQDQISTKPASMWVDANGTIQVTDWAAKGTADFTILDEDIIHGSVSILSATKRNLVNRVLVTLDYRFWNLRQRELSVTWSAPANFCDYLTKGFRLPSKEMFLSAWKGTGWNINSYGWTEVPDSGTYYCPVDPYIWVWTPVSKRFCIGSSATLDRRWGQRVTETYTLDVKSSQSITASGEMGVAEAYGIQSDYDISDWESPREHAGRASGSTLHDGGSGDYSVEADAAIRTEMEQAQTTVLAKAATEVLATHRNTRYTFGCALYPFMDLSKTVRVTYQAVVGAELFNHKVTGKIAELREILNIETGAATSIVSLAVSMHGGVGTDPDTTLDPIAQPTPTAETPFTPTVSLGFRLGPYSPAGGGIGDVDNLGDDDYNGYTTNESVALGAGEQYYDEGLNIIIPEIEDAAINNQALQATEVFTVDIPQDEFEIYK
jgi:hypothetical protein